MASLTSRLDQRWGRIFLALCAVLYAAIFAAQVLDWLKIFEGIERGDRVTLYSATAGVMAGLLGFSFAAIAILVSIPKERAVPRQVADFSNARQLTVGLLLATTLIMGIDLIFSFIGLVADRGVDAPSWLVAGMISCSLTAILGLFLAGSAMAVLMAAIRD